jgi:hypothetical protein
MKLATFLLLLLGMMGCGKPPEHPTITLDADYWECTQKHFQPIGMAVSFPCDQWTRKGLK